ncbi:TetR/AcrR family transcriptional regulator C-terminal domain-containing protein [Pseudonocardia sp. CA-107938]|uniref:TetR/AcrR family transcriptional regulator C-terminal domain-containing protein n=1 Tax=Pseudonocardia sp. CA-107938 TaxID=3240021 RepID=UPI003D8F4C9E
MALSPDRIVTEALDLLAETGVDGLGMRPLAARLDVRPSALYFHVRDKQQLLDAMAARIHAASLADLELPAPGVTWDDWLAERARTLRRALLAHRDGARVFAGSDVRDAAGHRALELTLRTLTAAGFPPRAAARSYPALYHFTIGFVIEEQTRTGPAAEIDVARFPLAAAAVDDLFDPDPDVAFEAGLSVVMDGLRAQLAAHSPSRSPSVSR